MSHAAKVFVLLSVVAIMVCAFFVGDYLSRKRAFAERTTCIGSLIRIRLTKEVYAQDQDLTNGAVIPDAVIWQDIGAVERCLAGGHYSINAVGVDPSCSYNGAVRWKGRTWGHIWPE